MIWRSQWGFAVLMMLPVPVLAQGGKSEELVGTWGRTYIEEKPVLERGVTRMDTVTVNDTLVINADGTMRRTFLENGKPSENIVTRLKWSYVSDTLWTTYGLKGSVKTFSVVQFEENGRKMILGGELISVVKGKDGKKDRKYFQSLAWNDEPYTHVGR